MKRLSVLAVLVGLAFTLPVVRADDVDQKAEGEKQVQEEKKAQSTAVEKLQADPNDVAAWRSYLNENLVPLLGLVDTDPDAAEKQLKELKEFVSSLQPDAPDAKRQAATILSTLNRYDDVIATGRMSLEELGKQLKAAPDDGKSLSQFMLKVSRQIGGLARTEPDQAGKLLAEARAAFTAAQDAATTDGAKKLYQSNVRLFDSLQRTIESAQKLAAMIGKDAAPLSVDAWVNGEPLTDTDLQGKVVLLDFWAVWCGPCIATFPHLREWQEKYGEKGLVMIGVTNYYNFEWDDTAGRAKRSMGQVAHEAEHEMLKKFATHHQLRHRFALEANRALSQYYAVTGIPHVVVIDQSGKIRLMRVGSGEANAKAIGELLEKLLGAPKVAGN